MAYHSPDPEALCYPSAQPSFGGQSVEMSRDCSNSSSCSHNSTDSTDSNATYSTSHSSYTPTCFPALEYYAQVKAGCDTSYEAQDQQHFSLSTARSASINQPLERPTPKTLGWEDTKSLENYLAQYTFVVKKGSDPYFKLKSTLVEGLSQEVYLDKEPQPEKGIYPCQWPSGCWTKSGKDGKSPKATVFKRPADLERHYTNVHAPADQKLDLPCDYAPCARATGKLKPFTRQDHRRDHYKDFHKEDIGCAKGERKATDKDEWLKAQEIWLQERRVSVKWWRCKQCLQRIHVATGGWECDSCKVACEPERREARLRKAREAMETDTDPSMEDAECELDDSNQLYEDAGASSRQVGCPDDNMDDGLSWESSTACASDTTATYPACTTCHGPWDGTSMCMPCLHCGEDTNYDLSMNRRY